MILHLGSYLNGLENLSYIATVENNLWADKGCNSSWVATHRLHGAHNLIVLYSLWIRSMTQEPQDFQKAASF